MMEQGHEVPARALVLGGLAGQLDAVVSLRSRGWEVHVCGRDREGPAIDVADGFHTIDIVDVDAVTDLAAKLGVKFVYSVGSDIAMPTISHVSERLDLPHFLDVERTRLLRDKAALRGFLSRHGLSPVAHRRVLHVDDLDAPFAYPAMLKPVDSQGQRGIALVTDRDEAVAALPASLACSLSGSAILEEYLDGPEISVHVYLVNGRIAFYEPSDRHVWDGPLPGVAQKHTMPSNWVSEHGVERELRELVEAFVAALGMQNGPLYLQLKLTSRGPRIIEVAARLDGCHLWRLIHILYRVDLLRACWASLTRTDPPALDRATSGRTGTLWLHLVQPDHPVDVPGMATGTDERVVFEEFHLDQRGMPRDTNGIVARAGYRITIAGDL
jgi:phosphoribosylamine-glycine ligase